jgi:hypothetical protein
VPWGRGTSVGRSRHLSRTDAAKLRCDGVAVKPTRRKKSAAAKKKSAAESDAAKSLVSEPAEVGIHSIH